MTFPVASETLDSHPGVLRVEHKPESDESWVTVERGFKKGETIGALEGLTKHVPKAYSSVQIGPEPNDHIELNSSFLFVNHSCNPNVAFIISTSIPEDEWRVEALKDIKPGEMLTFFYPSTEWTMDRPFDCRCGEATCAGRISGASHMPRIVLKKQAYMSPHITKLKEEQN